MTIVTGFLPRLWMGPRRLVAARVGRYTTSGTPAGLLGSALLTLVCLGSATSLVAQEDAVQAKPSTYAPAADLERQLGMLREALEKELGDDGEYSDSAQTRVARTANTVVVVGQVLGLHDEESKYKPAAATLVAAGESLRDAADNLEQARAALVKLQSVLDNPVAGDSQVAWKPVADMAMMMEHVPTLNSRLRRGMLKSRFERVADDTASYAATLAAVAQASAIDTVYCSDAEDEKAWQAMCVEYRTAMGDLVKAVRAADFDAAKAAMDRGAESCDTCHERFRD